MSAQIDRLMELGKTYGWAVSDYEDRRTDDTLDAMELAEQEFRYELAKSVNQAPKASTAGVLTGQILVMATLLQSAINVVKNVEAEGCDEGELLQQLIDDSEAAIATVLKQHAMPTTTVMAADPPDHHPV